MTVQRDDDLITLATFGNELEAQVARTKLESDGIEAFVADDVTLRMNGFWSAALGGVKLRVRRRDEAEAKRSLEENVSTEE